MKKNDVYQFRYNDDYRKSDSNPYHCFDGILIVRETEEGKFFLEDTYCSHGNRRFTPDEAESLGTMTFVCNLDEVTKVSESELVYYDSSDVVVLDVHAGHRREFYLRKGATKSSEKMIRTLREKIENAEQTIRSRRESIEQWSRQIAEIESGNTEIYI